MDSGNSFRIFFKPAGCAPCHAMRNLLAGIEKVAGIPIDWVDCSTPEGVYEALSRGVRTVPCAILYKDGLEAWRRAGISGAPMLMKAAEDAGICDLEEVCDGVRQAQ